MNKYFGLIVLLILFVGCTKTNPYDTTFVEGTVQLDGVPVEGVNVNFTPIGNGNSAGGLTDSSGKFRLTTGSAPVGSGAIAGEYNVTFSKIEIEGSNLTFEESQKQFGSRPPKTIYIVPKKYDNAANSGIAPVTIEKGKKNVFNFDLSTK
ncbi:MAG: carboxypeptidase-like regulatory domain-containing protein [Planctomycetaceae bacterium]|jgi:hypothetical protein|nr:carboxypeptidase-like regulatory domain-containing protein [Planctomycetaceae bacterium]